MSSQNLGIILWANLNKPNMKNQITLFIFLFSLQLIGQNNYQRIKLVPTDSEVLLLQKAGIDVSEGFNLAEGFIESDYSAKEAAIIDKVVANDFWNCTRDVMASHFKKGEFKEGIIAGILNAGEQLKHFFPWQTDDTNELSNEISKG